RVLLISGGMAASPLDGRALARALRAVGDPSPAGQLRRDSWVTAAGVHHCLAGTVASTADWTGLLAAAAASRADRTVVSVAVELDGRGTRTRGAVRLGGAGTPPAGAGPAGVAGPGRAPPVPRGPTAR